MNEQLVLVDRNDTAIGVMDKLQAHQEGHLHRAFSIFVFNAAGELLLQRRNPQKYHSGGLWANTCCSHPRPGETLAAAAHRRLGEEMGFDCKMETGFSFIYKVLFDNGLIEHEYDHVFVGYYDDDPLPNPTEVVEWQWIGLADLQQRISARPQDYVHWLRLIFERVMPLTPEDLYRFGQRKEPQRLAAL
jgi:isopentenyl-diphosphate delta-isomerase